MDPLTFTAGATAIAGGLDFAGGLLSSHKSNKYAKESLAESRRQFDVQDDYNKNFINYRVQDAIKSGVNPLAALGSGAGHYSPTISAGGSYTSGTGDGMSRAGDRLLQFAQAYERRAIKDNDEMSKLSLEEKKLQNSILRARLSEMTQPGNIIPGDNDPITTVVDTNPLSRYDNPRDRFRAVRRLGKYWMTKNGTIVDMWNPDAVADAESDNIEAVRLGLQDYPHRGWWSDLKRWYRGDRYVPSSHTNHWLERWNSRQRTY